MKKILCVLLVVLMCLTAAPLGGFADLDLGMTASALNATGKCGDNVTYTYDSTTGELVISGTGAIAAEAFYQNQEIKNVIIGDGITEIGIDAFNASSITSVTIGDSVTTIGDGAFGDCYSLTSVTIGNSVTTIGDSAFAYCNILTSVTIPDSVTTIGNSAFRSCNSLTSVDIPNSVASIGTYAFFSCDKLESVVIGNRVTHIKGYTFQYCRNLKNVIIPNSVTDIYIYAFYHCTNLETISIPKSILSIKDEAFRYCSSLTDVYYEGAEENWNAIEIGQNNTALDNATIHFAETHTHTWDVEEITKHPTCTEKGEKIIKCKNAICEKLEEIPATGHEWIHASCTTPKTCNKCGVTEGEALGHTFTEQKLGKKYLKSQATCGKKAVYYYSCSVCGESSANTAEEKTFEYGTAPDHNWGTAVKVAATCTEDEMMVQTCSRCNQKYVKKTSVKALGHSYGSDGKCKNAGCTETCPHSGKKETIYGKPATCTNPGVSDGEKCKECGVVTKIQTVIPALGHKWDSGVVTKDATCMEYGEVVYKCINNGCGETKTNVIEKLYHDYKEETTEPTCDKDGYTKYTCTMCGSYYIDKAVKAYGHLFTTEKVIIKAPTCIAEGKKAIRCERCHAIEPGTEEVVPATHSYPDNWSVVIAPDCQNTGFAVKVCFNCHDVIAQTVPKSGHADLDGDSKCDTCEMIIVVEPEEPTEPDTPDIPDVPEEKPCDCDCHAGGIKAFFFNFLNFFAKLFDKSARVCKCGASH